MKIPVYLGSIVVANKPPGFFNVLNLDCDQSGGMTDTPFVVHSSRMTAAATSISLLPAIGLSIPVIVSGTLMVSDHEVYRQALGDDHCKLDTGISLDLSLPDERALLFSTLKGLGKKIIFFRGKEEADTKILVLDRSVFKKSAYSVCCDRSNGIWSTLNEDRRATNVLIQRIARGFPVQNIGRSFPSKPEG
jgi:hypothetical protein